MRESNRMNTGTPYPRNNYVNGTIPRGRPYPGLFAGRFGLWRKWDTSAYRPPRNPKRVTGGVGHKIAFWVLLGIWVKKVFELYW